MQTSDQESDAYPKKPDNVFHSPLAGDVCEQFIRCGKTGCRCRQGHLHGPYYYRIWREGRQVRKVYVKASEVESVRAACDANKDLTRSLRAMKVLRLQLTQNIVKEWRRTQKLTAK